jgi:uncharacterized surface protein with fasciclin (FAS1) repeats
MHPAASGHFMAKDVKSSEVMTLQGSTLTAAGSSSDLRVNGARVNRPIWSRQTASFTASMS